MYDYGQKIIQVHRTSPMDPIGMSISAASGRLSMFLGVEGPTFTLDSACSSSVTVLHLMKQLLQNRECNLGICGAVNLQILPEMNIDLTEGLKN
jgi:acyl transferase domain-containing protein